MQRKPADANSTANDLVNASSPPLAAVYAASPGRALGPAIDVILMIEPLRPIFFKRSAIFLARA